MQEVFLFMVFKFSIYYIVNPTPTDSINFYIWNYYKQEN